MLQLHDCDERLMEVETRALLTRTLLLNRRWCSAESRAPESAAGRALSVGSPTDPPSDC